MVVVDLDLFEDMPTEAIEIEIDDFEGEVTQRYAVIPNELVHTREMPAVEVALLSLECAGAASGDKP
jgi:hypothetical protein